MDYEMGSPSRQVKRNAFNLSNLIESELFHNTFKIWVEGLVVFTYPDVSLELNEPSVTVLKINDLFNYVTDFRQMSKLSKKDLQSIGNFIVGASKDLPLNLPSEKITFIAQPPIQEEAKAKSWWQFWRGGIKSMKNWRLVSGICVIIAAFLFWQGAMNPYPLSDRNWYFFFETIIFLLGAIICILLDIGDRLGR